MNARLAGVLNCSNPFDSEAIKEVINSNDNVVVIENPFSSEWIYTVLDIISAPDKFIILVTPFTEDDYYYCEACGKNLGKKLPVSVIVAIIKRYM